MTASASHPPEASIPQPAFAVFTLKIWQGAVFFKGRLNMVKSRLP